jgi:hypothetical protein
MTGLIRTHVLTLTGDARPIVLMSDLDEIPARHTVDLLKNCDFGPSIHLQLRDYLYRSVPFISALVMILFVPSSSASNGT